MTWKYGKEMLEDEMIANMSEWSDDKEVAYSVMDTYYDYLWYFEDGIKFVDRLYAFNDPDDLTLSRMECNEAVLEFDSFEDLFRWILKANYDGEYRKWIERRMMR